MNLQLDILEGHNIQRTRTGWEITRPALVTELDGAGAERLVRALSAPGMPQIGDPHPYAPGAVLEQVSVTSFDNDNGAARLALVYATPTADNSGGVVGRGGVRTLAVEFFASTLTERTSEDGNGNPMINFYRGPVVGGLGSAISLELVRELVEADVFRPQLGVRIQHERPELPRTLAPKMIGTVNADDWSGYPAGTWLCIAFTAANDQGPWVCNFEALYRATGWQLEHQVKINGIPLERAEVGNGIALFDLYPRVAWREMGLTF